MGQICSVCCCKNTDRPNSLTNQVEKSEEAAALCDEESTNACTNVLQTNEKQEIQKEVGNVKIVTPTEASPIVPQVQFNTNALQTSETHEIQDGERVKIFTSETTPDIPQLQHQDYISSPLLLDKDTIDYVKRSRVMVVLKGLPGSGKSRIARKIAEIYKDTVICSADDFFIQDGVYKFDKDELKNAHETCQKKALEAAQRGRNIIVIDNTNVRAWESKYYLKLAGQYQYVPLILEAATPWAKDPDELAKRNSHGVTKNVLERKVKDYEPVLPLYYWWYLNKADSNAVMTLARDWLRKALKVHEFFQDFSTITKLSTVDDMLNYYGKSQQSGGYGLHVTACVTRKGKEENAMKYITSDVVRKSLGKCFSFPIIGFVITPRAFGARLRLGENALELWGMNDNEIEKEEHLPDNTDTGVKSGNKVEASSLTKTFETHCNLEEESNSTAACLTVVPSQIKDVRFSPTIGKGSRAHLTLGCAPGIHAKVTGFDLIKVISHEQEYRNMNREGMNNAQNLERYDITGGVLIPYGEGVWVVYPEDEVIVQSFFSAYY
ncbi:hypothetical protein Pcinc_042134 [Petrolisthes cinctipes]|uniref:2',3'-cyclic-nucleotide 3'-phosphodiesterase n=1 Tax=Petrolisthes cinctipes TaxID=88211 RepID=A0AAE1EH73_PETCI|nr:hypothetical protein Pcinc_042134 [Petrolisthes cinctipes]